MTWSVDTHAVARIHTAEMYVKQKTSMNVLLTHAKTGALAMTWSVDTYAIARIHTAEMYVKQLLDVLRGKLEVVKQGWKRLSVIQLQPILKRAIALSHVPVVLN